ncbi:MAG: hypothetical protein Q9195_006975 [Heterodermia aff. obscurata]
MLPKQLLAYAVLPGAGIASCITQQQQTLRVHTAPYTGENGLALVPLNETATTGIVPVDVEQTILRSGNRFANEFYANISADGELGSCFSCVPTVVKELPCVYKAIKDKNPGEILNCGITKADLCKCVDCLPPVVRQFVELFCKAEDDVDVKDLYNYNTFYHLADVDLNLQAFLVSPQAPHPRLLQALMFSERALRRIITFSKVLSLMVLLEARADHARTALAYVSLIRASEGVFEMHDQWRGA